MAMSVEEFDVVSFGAADATKPRAASLIPGLTGVFLYLVVMFLIMNRGNWASPDPPRRWLVHGAVDATLGVCSSDSL